MDRMSWMMLLVMTGCGSAIPAPVREAQPEDATRAVARSIYEAQCGDTFDERIEWRSSVWASTEAEGRADCASSLLQSVMDDGQEHCDEASKACPGTATHGCMYQLVNRDDLVAWEGGCTRQTDSSGAVVYVCECGLEGEVTHGCGPCLGCTCEPPAEGVWILDHQTCGDTTSPEGHPECGGTCTYQELIYNTIAELACDVVPI